MCPKKLISH